MTLINKRIKVAYFVLIPYYRGNILILTNNNGFNITLQNYNENNDDFFLKFLLKFLR